MIPINYEVFKTFEMNSTSSHNAYLLFRDGLEAAKIYATTTDKGRVLSEIMDSRHPYTRQIKIHAYIYAIFKRSKTYADLKGDLSDLAAYFRGTPSNEATTQDKEITGYIDELLENIRAYQKGQHALESSVVTGCCPIVPYAGTLKKPFVDMKVDDSVLQEILAKVTESEVITVADHATLCESLRQDALEHLSNMVMISKCMACIMMYPSLVDRSKMVEYTISQFISTAATMNQTNAFYENHVCADVFTLWLWVYEHVDMIVSKNTAMVVQAITNIRWKPFQETLDTFMKDLPAIESRLIDELDQYDAMQKFMKDPDKFSDTNTSVNPIDMFDLQPLMNYIFTNRRFRANRYTNSSFMTMPQVGGYIFYEDFLIIQPMTADGNEVNFLYVPVIDDLNGSQVVVLKYWRNGRIDVLSQREYMTETQSATMTL